MDEIAENDMILFKSSVSQVDIGRVYWNKDNATKVINIKTQDVKDIEFEDVVGRVMFRFEEDNQ